MMLPYVWLVKVSVCVVVLALLVPVTTSPVRDNVSTTPRSMINTNQDQWHKSINNKHAGDRPTGKVDPSGRTDSDPSGKTDARNPSGKTELKHDDYDDDLFIDEDPQQSSMPDEVMLDDEVGGAQPAMGSGSPPAPAAPVTSSTTTSTQSPSSLTFLDAELQNGYSDDSADLGSAEPPANKAATAATSQSTKCQLLRSRALAGLEVFYTPVCEPNGDYKPLQCKDDQCWCVDEDGRVIPYTRQRVTDTPPTCETRKRRKEFLVDTDSKKAAKVTKASVVTVLTTIGTRTTPLTPTVGQQSSMSYWLFMRTDILAGIFVGTGVGLICAVVLVICIVHRMKKKDEGSYVLDEPRRPSPCQQPYQRAPTREVYA